MEPKIVPPPDAIKLQVNEDGDLIVFGLVPNHAEPRQPKRFSPERDITLHVHLVGNERVDYIPMKSARIHSRPYRRAFSCPECGLRIVLTDLLHTESDLRNIFGNYNPW